MCGIIGILTTKPVAKDLIESLKRLEYRGYDSAGICLIENNNLTTIKAKGKVIELEKELSKHSLNGQAGIGHIRWATHGKPSVKNAHPHINDKVAVVHNGIIENYLSLKKYLIDKNFEFRTETDTEVIPHLIADFLQQGFSPLISVQKAVKMLEGAFAIAVIFEGADDLIIGARKGAPLAVGYGDGENYIGSDSIALNHLTDKITYLEEEDVVLITKKLVTIYDKNDTQVSRQIKIVEINLTLKDKGNFEHYMLKEIFEQPKILDFCLHQHIDIDDNKFKLPKFNFDWQTVPKITIIACGTSYYAAMVAKYWFESIANIAVEIDIASEFRYRKCVLPLRGVAIFVSQSGETADTLAALRYAKSLDQYTISVVNVKESSMAREADSFVEIHAGVEIGVASTKAFTAQLMSLATIVIQSAYHRKKINDNQLNDYITELSSVAGMVNSLLNIDQEIKKVAKTLTTAKNILYIGRGTSYAIALEGALKLKELSYIHAEALAAGELKHGTIALIDEEMPIIIVAPKDHLFEKTCSNVHEIAARGGKIITISDKFGNKQLNDIAHHSIDIYSVGELSAPILYTIPIQLLAYYVAHHLQKDIDQPRNLAKSVTVE
jgi:glucosamine--fructose-6-phosphate aminotransferase (isomerizing)